MCRQPLQTGTHEAGGSARVEGAETHAAILAAARSASIAANASSSLPIVDAFGLALFFRQLVIVAGATLARSQTL